MRRFSPALMCIVLLLMTGVLVVAQTEPRDYVVSDLDVAFSADNTEFTLSFTVTNEGGDAQNETDIIIVALNQGSQGSRVILTEPQDIIDSGDSVDRDFTFLAADFPENSIQPLRVEVGIDLYEIAGTVVARDNRAEISVEIPATGDSATPTTTPSENSNSPVAFNDDGSITVAGRTFEQSEILTGVVAAVGVVILLWLLSVLLRLIFRRPQRVGNWQPPYSMMPTLDPNSTEGRRQAWQQHAQNGSILAMPTEGNVHPVKLLLSTDQDYLKNWRVTAIRLSQYDNYGRVGRSEMIASKKSLIALTEF